MEAIQVQSPIQTMLDEFRASQIAAGIPEDELMPEDAAKAVKWLIAHVPEYQ